jgi:hypothetical protein
MEKQIFIFLKKYYFHFNEKKFSKLLSCKTDEETFDTFQKLWKKEHGGLFKLGESFTPPEILPYIKDNKIIITDTGSNSIKFHKLYIKKLNQLIIDNKNNYINLDFSNNFGGKPQVMIAGLLPIFNNFNVSTLSYYYDKSDNKHRDIIRMNNKIICISNNRAYSIGTKKICKVSTINIYFNNYTISSAEQAIICLLSLSNNVKINLFGKKSGGYTTVNKYIQLSDMYGIEIPLGYMGTKTKIYYNGIY